MNRIEQLTFTRFVMVLLVLFYHGTSEFYIGRISSPAILSLLKSASMAVSYLFVLSGFVMSLAYFRPNERFDVFKYWRSRFAKLYPLYGLAFALICLYYADSLFRIKPQKILANIFIVQSWIPSYSQSFNYPAWSMPVEFFFYALFPFFTMWAYRQTTKNLIWTSVAVWVASQVFHTVLWSGLFPVHKDFLVYFPPFHLSSFIIGALGGIWYVREGRRRKHPDSHVNLILLLSFLILLSFFAANGSFFPMFHELQMMAGMFAPVMVVFILSLSLSKNLLSRALKHPILANFGEASYGIYILHIPVLWLFERAFSALPLADPSDMLAITYLPTMIFMGLLIYIYVDKPLRRWLAKLLQKNSLRILLFDIVILTLSAFLVFRFRFGNGREYESYREMERFVFWVAFFARIPLAALFGSLNPIIIHRPLNLLIRPLILSISIGSLIITGAVFVGYSTGWFENFPRSIFLYDWLVVFSLSLLVRLGFRALKVYKPDPIPA